MSGRLDVIRVDIHTRGGRELANQMGFEYTPTFFYSQQMAQNSGVRSAGWMLTASASRLENDGHEAA